MNLPAMFNFASIINSNFLKQGNEQSYKEILEEAEEPVSSISLDKNKDKARNSKKHSIDITSDDSDDRDDEYY